MDVQNLASQHLKILPTSKPNEFIKTFDVKSKYLFNGNYSMNTIFRSNPERNIPMVINVD